MKNWNSRAKELLNRGISSHNSGDVAAAQVCYRKVLMLDPNQADAHHLLGVTEYQKGNNVAAIRVIKRAISLKPNVAIYYQNMGNAFFSSGNFIEAEKSYRLASRLEPENTDICYNLGRTYQRLNRFSEALDCYGLTLKKQPDHFWANYYCGEICQENKQYQEAINFFNRVLELKPDFADAYKQLGLIYQSSGDYSTALVNFEKARVFEPEDPVLLARMGILLQSIGRLEDAAEVYQQALELKPDYHEVLGNLSGVYRELARYSVGLEFARSALKIEPLNPVYLNNYGNLLLKLNRFDEARAIFKQALNQDPCFDMAYVNLSAACLADHDLKAAIKYNRQALLSNPADVHANWNQALLELHSGNLKSGFEAYEWRWQKSDFEKIKRNYTQPRWDGKPHPDSTLLVWAEQGFGDTIQFIRFIAQVKPLFKKVVVEVQAKLLTLIETMPEIDTIIAAGSEYQAFDYHIPLLSIPQYFLSDVKSIPARTSYLSTIANECNIAELITADFTGLKIGINWAGSPSHENDHNRSIQLKAFKPLLDVDNIQLYGLQLGAPRAELIDWPDNDSITDLSDYLSDFAATARILDSLDLIITVDTAMAHLAGAMGRPVWVLLPYQSDWRWLYDREDSPWYPTMRLFRQSRNCRWDGVIRQVVAALRAQM